MNLVATCICSSIKDLEAHDAAMKPISLKYAIRKIGVQELRVTFGLYAWGRQKGLRMVNDWAVDAVRSVWKGKPCITIFHSRIHYIFQ